MFVGEQPGDREDREGRPFVGPAGLLLDKALVEAGVDRSRVYVTNAVKHFKFEQRGKRRLHKRPNAGEIKICRHWLFDEIEAVNPRLIVALGATAAQGLTGRAIPVQSNRGAVLNATNGSRVFITIHPSALLRLQDEEEKRSGYASFVSDLRSELGKNVVDACADFAGGTFKGGTHSVYDLTNDGADLDTALVTKWGKAAGQQQVAGSLVTMYDDLLSQVRAGTLKIPVSTEAPASEN